MSRIAVTGALLAGAFLVGLSGCRSGMPAPGSQPEGQWVWEGKRRIDSFMEVPPGVTLRLQPGTVLEFPFRDGDGDGYGDNGLHVRGRIAAEGSAASPILLTSGERSPRPGDWEGLLIENSRGNVFEHCTVEYARYAFHAHFSSGRISSSRIVRNIEGTRLGDSRFEIAYSLIAGNLSKGVNFRASGNRIHHNTVTENGHGIFLFETDTGSIVEQNNIHGNEGYDLRLGDFYEGGFSLRGNWWGTADRERIMERIYEGEGGVRGRVTVAPAPAPVATGREAP